MSLFKWSTPERQSADRVLPTIPNEIYFHIFEHIAPPSGRLTPEELGIFTCLSRVCRFFANSCLPRIFEFIEFSGAVFRDDMSTAINKASRESTLCTQIAARQPLALALAKTVRVCHFTHWNLFDDTGAWAVRLFAKKYIAGMSHMKNIRELKFTDSFVDAEHWSAIATLGSLEELSFEFCLFLQGPADVEPEKWVKLKVSRLEVVQSKHPLQPIAAIDTRCLRSLATDFTPYDHFDWLPESALTELRLYLHFDCWHRFQEEDGYMEWLHAILMRTPRSVGTLGLFFDVPLGPAPDVVRRMFDHTVWKNMAFIRSLTLRILAFHQDTPAAILSSALEGIDLLTELQSFTLKGGWMSPEMSPTEIRCVLHEKLGPTSNLKDIDVYGRVLRLVDGQWSEVSSSSAQL